MNAVDVAIQDTLNRIQEKITKFETGHTIFILNLRSDNYTLNQPIPVWVETEEGEIVLSSEDVDMYGTGSNLQEALDDLCGAIVEYYQYLKEEKDNLGPLLKKDYQFLNLVISEIKNCS